jgi:hypothetical protein
MNTTATNKAQAALGSKQGSSAAFLEMVEIDPRPAHVSIPYSKPIIVRSSGSVLFLHSVMAEGFVALLNAPRLR